MIDRSSKVALGILLALVFVFGSLTWLNSADALVPKCKADTHIAVTVAAPYVRFVRGAVSVVHDVPGQCRNVPGAVDDYDVTINGRPGMHLLDSAVAVFVDVANANPGEPLTIEHTVNHVLMSWRSFTAADVEIITTEIGH